MNISINKKHESAPRNIFCMPKLIDGASNRYCERNIVAKAIPVVNIKSNTILIILLLNSIETHRKHNIANDNITTNLIGKLVLRADRSSTKKAIAHIFFSFCTFKHICILLPLFCFLIQFASILLFFINRYCIL